jgi:hypothetical protein
VSGELKQHFSGTGIQHFTGEALARFELPLPPLPELRQAVAKFEALFAETQRLGSLYERKLAALEGLKKSLLHRAFSGELTGATRKPVIVPFPIQIPSISATDLHAGILALAYQLHEQNGNLKFFGHVKAEKIAHMVEAHVGIDLERTPVKDAAGPNDYPHLKRVEHRAKKAGYFVFERAKGPAYRVTKLRRYDALIERAKQALGNRRMDVDQLLELMLPMDTQQAEIFTTVYAAWNNLLLDQQPVTDERIVLEARDNWHPSKLKIPREKFFRAIRWMKERTLVPLGRGKRVKSKATAE